MATLFTVNALLIDISQQASTVGSTFVTFAGCGKKMKFAVNYFRKHWQRKFAASEC